MKKYQLSRGADFVLRRLREKGYEGYLVGGCLRDFLLGLEPKDFDITTSARPEELERIFADQKLVKLGKAFGTIGILYEDQLVETTTFRCDGVYKDGRRPEAVSFSSSLQEDLKRRDFTINAMAMDLDGKIYDPFQGQEDLHKGLLRAVGDPFIRFEEDKLRMLRAVRFASTYDFTIEERTLAAIKAKAKDLRQVSAERIRTEVDKILLGHQPSRGLRILAETGLLGQIFPDLVATLGFVQCSPYHDKDLFGHIIETVDRSPRVLHLRLAALLHDIGKVDTLTIDENGLGHFYGHDQLGAQRAGEILKDLRYDKKTIDKVQKLIDRHMKASPQMGTKGLKRLIGKVGEDLIFDLLDLMIADLLATRPDRDPGFLIERKKQVQEILDCKSLIDKRSLAISGHDLIDLGYQEGRKIGLVLDYLTDQVLDEKIANNKEDLLVEAKKLQEKFND
ncbi:MAG: HD domain-containing protein [Bacillota bacterium]|nr:HD domain-containing protein [Bacillota bacterium]